MWGMKGPHWFLAVLLIAAEASQQHARRRDGLYDHKDDGASWDIRLSVPGEPELDYPVLNDIPVTSFTCVGRNDGYYADAEARCQVFKVCANNAPGGFFSFLCPNGTLFNQEVLVCDWWMNVKCVDLDSEVFSIDTRLALKPGPAMLNDIQNMISYPMQNPLPADYPATNHVMQVYNPPDDMLSMFQEPQSPFTGQELLGGVNQPNNPGFNRDSLISGTSFEQAPAIENQQINGFVSGSEFNNKDSTVQAVQQDDILSLQKTFNANAQQAIKIIKQQFTYPSAFDKQYTLTVPQVPPTASQPFIVNIPINIPDINANQNLVSENMITQESNNRHPSSIQQHSFKESNFNKSSASIESSDLQNSLPSSPIHSIPFIVFLLKPHKEITNRIQQDTLTKSSHVANSFGQDDNAINPSNHQITQNNHHNLLNINQNSKDEDLKAAEQTHLYNENNLSIDETDTSVNHHNTDGESKSTNVTNIKSQSAHPTLDYPKDEKYATTASTQAINNEQITPTEIIQYSQNNLTPNSESFNNSKDGNDLVTVFSAHIIPQGDIKREKILKLCIPRDFLSYLIHFHNTTKIALQRLEEKANSLNSFTNTNSGDDGKAIKSFMNEPFMNKIMQNLFTKNNFSNQQIPIVGAEEQYQQRTSLSQQEQTSTFKAFKGAAFHQNVDQQNTFGISQTGQGLQQNSNRFGAFKQNSIVQVPQNDGRYQQQNIQTTNSEHFKTGNANEQTLQTHQQQITNIERENINRKTVSNAFNTNQIKSVNSANQLSTFNTANRFSSKFNKETASFMQNKASENQVNDGRQTFQGKIKGTTQIDANKNIYTNSIGQSGGQTSPSSDSNGNSNPDDNNEYYNQNRITSGLSPTTITDEENQGEFYSVQQRFGRPKVPKGNTYSPNTNGDLGTDVQQKQIIDQQQTVTKNLDDEKIEQNIENINRNSDSGLNVNTFGIQEGNVRNQLTNQQNVQSKFVQSGQQIRVPAQENYVNGQLLSINQQFRGINKPAPFVKTQNNIPSQQTTNFTSFTSTVSSTSPNAQGQLGVNNIAGVFGTNDNERTSITSRFNQQIQNQRNIPVSTAYNRYDNTQNELRRINDSASYVQTKQNPTQQQISQFNSFSGTVLRPPQINSQQYQITKVEKQILDGNNGTIGNKNSGTLISTSKQTSGPSTSGFYVQSSQISQNFPQQQSRTSVFGQVHSNTPQTQSQNVQITKTHEQVVNNFGTYENKNRESETTRTVEEQSGTNLPTLQEYSGDINNHRGTVTLNNKFIQNGVKSAQQVNKYSSSTTHSQNNSQQIRSQYQQHFGSVNNHNRGVATVTSRISEEQTKITIPSSDNVSNKLVDNQQRQININSFTPTNTPTTISQNLQISRIQGQLASNHNYGQQVNQNLGISRTSNNYQENTNSVPALNQQQITASIYKTTQQKFNNIPVQSNHDQLFSIQKQFGGSNIPAPFTKSTQGPDNTKYETTHSTFTAKQNSYPQQTQSFQISKIEGQYYDDQTIKAFSNNGNRNVQASTSQISGQLNKGTFNGNNGLPSVHNVQSTQKTFTTNSDQQSTVLLNSELNQNVNTKTTQIETTRGNSFANTQPLPTLPSKQVTSNIALSNKNLQINQLTSNARHSVQQQNLNIKNIAAGIRQQSNTQKSSQILSSTRINGGVSQNKPSNSATAHQQNQQSNVFQSHNVAQHNGHQPRPQTQINNYQQQNPSFSHSAFDEQRRNVQTNIPINQQSHIGFTRVELVPAFGFAIDSDNERVDYLAAVSRGLQNVEKTYIAPYGEAIGTFGAQGRSQLQTANFNNGNIQNAQRNHFQRANFDTHIRSGFGSYPQQPSFITPQFSYDNSGRVLNNPVISSQVQVVRNLHQQTLPIEELGYPKIKPSISFSF